MNDRFATEGSPSPIERQDILELFRIDFPEAYRQHGIGSASDATIPAKWPIPLNEIGITSTGGTRDTLRLSAT